MFSLIDIITISSIIILLFFLLILFIMETGFTKHRTYLKTVLLIALFILLLDELIYLKQYDLVLWAYPFVISGLFSIYPLIYLYSRDLVFLQQDRDAGLPDRRDSPNGKDDNRPNLLLVLGFPIIVFIFISVLYYPLNYYSKIKFIDFHYVEPSSELKEFKHFQYFVIPAYYLQTVFYMIASLKLISVVKKNINSNPWELLIVRYILFYVICVIIYEAFIIVNTFIMIDNIPVLQTIDMLLSLLFISTGLYIGFKQSLILLQLRISRFSYKLEIRSDLPHAKSLLLETEKQKIKEAIENYFHDSKMYLDPNLKLENLSRKIHIPVKKISLTINKIYGKNFIGFINDLRISEVKKILLENYSDIKIDNVYTKVGFNSRSTFNRVFKSITGITPAEYITTLKVNKPDDYE